MCTNEIIDLQILLQSFFRFYFPLQIWLRLHHGNLQDRGSGPVHSENTIQNKGILYTVEKNQMQQYLGVSINLLTFNHEFIF